MSPKLFDQIDAQVFEAFEQKEKTRQCSCGQVYPGVPKYARYHPDDGALSGWYWECKCRSTLFTPDRKAES